MKPKPVAIRAMTAARRLAAILAADVVGYSRMMGEDEAGTAKSVRESREAADRVIVADGGRMFKTMGDGFLVEFPSLVAAAGDARELRRRHRARRRELSYLSGWVVEECAASKRTKSDGVHRPEKTSP